VRADVRRAADRPGSAFSSACRLSSNTSRHRCDSADASHSLRHQRHVREELLMDALIGQLPAVARDQPGCQGRRSLLLRPRPNGLRYRRDRRRRLRDRHLWSPMVRLLSTLMLTRQADQLRPSPLTWCHLTCAGPSPGHDVRALGRTTLTDPASRPASSSPGTRSATPASSLPSRSAA